MARRQVTLWFWAIVAAGLAWGIWTHYVLHRPVGAGCTVGDGACRDFCVPLQPTHRGAILTQLPKKGSLGICSRLCDRDSDCPAPMRCTEGAEYHDVTSLGFTSEAPDVVHFCAPPRRDNK